MWPSSGSMIQLLDMVYANYIVYQIIYTTCEQRSPLKNNRQISILLDSFSQQSNTVTGCKCKSLLCRPELQSAVHEAPTVPGSPSNVAFTVVVSNTYITFSADANGFSGSSLWRLSSSAATVACTLFRRNPHKLVLRCTPVYAATKFHLRGWRDDGADLVLNSHLNWTLHRLVVCCMKLRLLTQRWRWTWAAFYEMACGEEWQAISR